MADWVTGKVKKVEFWTDALFSLTVHAPIHPFTAGQFAKLGLEIDGERVQRAYSYVNAPDNPDLEFYLVTVPDGKLSPRLAALKPDDEIQIVSEAAGFFVWMKCRTARRCGCWRPALPSALTCRSCNTGKTSTALTISFSCMPHAMPQT